MLRTFISYMHVEPDKDLASYLCDFLKKQGWKVFLDTKIKVGDEWAQEIDRRIHSSQLFIVLLSSESIRSPMVRQEVKLAHQLRSAGNLRIIPIRIDFLGELPYDLASYLNPLQYALWTRNEPFHKLCKQILSVINRNQMSNNNTETPVASEEGFRLLAEATETKGAPLPSADIRLETGTLGLDSPFYIRRDADRAIEKLVVQPGSTIIIKGPRQVGKSSLLARAIEHARKNGNLVFYLDLQLVDSQRMKNLGKFFRYLANHIHRSFRTQFKPSEIWDDLLGEKDNLSYFLEQSVLEGTETRLIIALDEVDRIFGYSYRDDFFATLRGWHNNRAIKKIWNKLNILIAHATDPVLWIQDLNQSPFNVGNRFRLSNFTFIEVSALNDRHGSPLKTAIEIEDLIQLVGGQPYLTRQALYCLKAGNMTFNELKRQAVKESGLFGDHLRSRLWTLRNCGKLKKAIKRILHNNLCEDEEDFQSLVATGLIKGETRYAAEISCDLYRDYFKKHV